MKAGRDSTAGLKCTPWKIRAVAAAALVSLFVLCSISAAAAAANGKIAFASDLTGSWQVYTMNPDGSDELQVTNLAATDDDLLVPSISPNGRQIVFTYNSGDGPDLYVINVDGSGIRQLTDDHSSLWARWSPNGKRLVFTAGSKFGTGIIATMAADGTGKRKILTTDEWESAGGFYTPDAKQIVFGSQMGGFVSAVWVMDADGSHQRRLTRAAVRAQPWGISPDGNQIVGYTNQNSPAALGGDIFVMNLNGSNRRRLAPLSKFHHDIYPSFSPDGTKVSFISDRFSTDIDEFTLGTFDILTVNADGTGVANVLPSAGHCPHDGNCVTPLWGSSPH